MTSQSQIRGGFVLMKNRTLSLMYDVSGYVGDVYHVGGVKRGWC